MSGKKRGTWKKFWLYIVTDGGTKDPQLHCIQNPSTSFRIGEVIFATGFIISETAWQERAIETSQE
jgi:hypothetical protein